MEPEVPEHGKALQFLRWFCPRQLQEGIEGDLVEQYQADLVRLGRRRSGVALWFNVFKFFRPGIILRSKFMIRIFNMVLLSNYFKVSFRYLARNKTFALVNVLGLSLGMAAALLIYIYVRYETSFDSFHAQVDNLYRLTSEWNPDKTPNDKRATVMPWAGPGVKEAFPEVVEFSRFAPISIMTGDNFVRYNNTELTESRIFLADPGFLKMFSFQMLMGDKNTALSAPHQIILTESVAKRYFGDETPIGKVVNIDSHGNLSGSEFKVTGVIQDPPANSHMAFDFLVSYSSNWEGLNNGSTYWHWDNTYSYLLLHPGTDVTALENKISEQRVKQFGDEFGEWQDVVHFKLQSVKSIHLYSSLQNEVKINGDGQVITFLSITGIFILLCAYINYINMTSAKALGRRVEVGVRKVIGSSRHQLRIQIIAESLIINLFALFLSLVVAGLCLPLLSNVMQIPWSTALGITLSKQFIGYVVLIVLGGAILSAWYPAATICALKPVEAIKGNAPSFFANERWSIRKSLIVLQFAFCMMFTIGTVALYGQLKFMKEYDLGMDLNHVVGVKVAGFTSYKNYEAFRDKLSVSNRIQSVGSSSARPGDEISILGLKYNVRVGDRQEPTEVKWVTIDQGYFKTLNIQLLAGRQFATLNTKENSEVLVNEVAMKALGFDTPQDIIGQPLHNMSSEPLQIVGVIKNFNQRSLKSSHEPMVFVPNWIKANDLGWNKTYYFAKLNANHPSELKEALTEIEAAWKVALPDQPFQFFFLDSYFDSYYQAEQTFSSLFLFFSAFAIFIACLGLFGLVAYIVVKRTKEIGIRKVLGASVANVLMLLCRDFVKLIIVAALLTIPLMVWMLNAWLKTYAFRIDLGLWIFVYPILLIFTLSILTVVSKSFSVATSNPMDSIRYE